VEKRGVGQTVSLKGGGKKKKKERKEGKKESWLWE